MLHICTADALFLALAAMTLLRLLSQALDGQHSSLQICDFALNVASSSAIGNRPGVCRQSLTQEVV